MVWNASRPADSDRIRLSAGLLRDNFQAIETGTVPYDTLSLQQQGSFPALAGSLRLYSYLNADSGQIELQSVNDAGTVVKITQGAYLGTQNTLGRFAAIQTGNISFDGIFVYGSQNMVVARASILGTGTTTQNLNLTASRLSQGRYQITIPAGVLLIDSYQILMNIQYQPFQVGVIPVIFTKPIVNPALPTVIVVEMRTTSGSYALGDQNFEICIVGGRA